ncbi:MAG: hypothetical protein P1P80_01925 [ANME-2 cluster archaeon]|nr:hypothetical protein [ANME-2 cluster archaeon]
MDDKQRFMLIIAVGLVGLFLLVGGSLLLMYIGNEPGEHEVNPSHTDNDALNMNFWFNGSRYINTSDQWAYIELSFPPEYEGLRWDVSVSGVGEDEGVFIYSLDSRINSSVNGVKLNLENDLISEFDCFYIEVSLGDMSQTERVCLQDFEVR